MGRTMAVEWYLRDLQGDYGPFGSAGLRKKLGSFTSLENVLIWREGFQDWKPVAEVFESSDDPSALNQRRLVKRRWALYGLALGILLFAADVIFEWRGKQYLPWAGNTAENIGRVVGSVGIPALLFFLVGALKDALFSPWNVGARTAAVAAETSPQIATGVRTAHGYHNFIARNWRGEYPLFVSYWIFGVIGNWVLPLIMVGLAGVFDSKAGFRPIYLFGFILSVWLAYIGMSGWLWVGVWRSANRYIERKSLRLERAPWGGVAKLMAVIAFVQIAAAMIVYGIPQVTEATGVAFMDDPRIPPYSIRVMRNGTEAEITGGIKYGLTDDFRKILGASRQIKVVHLNSIGGRIGEGEKLYSLFRDMRLTTYVSAECLSACTLAFSGGVERVLLHGAILGFHRGSFAGADQPDSAELRGQRKIFTEAGYDAPFIAHALATPSSQMWRPSETELLKSGVITKVSNGSDYAFSGLPVDATREALSKLIGGSTGIFVVIRERFPKEYDDIVSSYYHAFVAGKTATEATAVLRDQLGAVISANSHLADDDVLIDLGNLVADQLATLQKQSTANCYNFAATGGIYNDMPSALAKREFDINERILRTATTRPGADAQAKELWPKFSGRLAAKGITKSDLDLVQGAKVADRQQAKFCSVLIALYREAAALPQREGAVILRSLVSAK